MKNIGLKKMSEVTSEERDKVLSDILEEITHLGENSEFARARREERLGEKAEIIGQDLADRLTLANGLIEARQPLVEGYRERIKDMLTERNLARLEGLLPLVQETLEKEAAAENQVNLSDSKRNIGMLLKRHELPLTLRWGPGLRGQRTKKTTETGRKGTHWPATILCSYALPDLEAKQGEGVRALWLAVDPWGRLIIVVSETEKGWEELNAQGAVLNSRHPFHPGLYAAKKLLF